MPTACSTQEPVGAESDGYNSRPDMWAMRCKTGTAVRGMISTSCEKCLQILFLALVNKRVNHAEAEMEKLFEHG